MGDVGEYWKDVKEHQQNQRWINYDRTIERLKQLELEFKEFDNGHIRIGEYDLWATTGTFIHRPTNTKDRGIEKLLKKLKN